MSTPVREVERKFLIRLLTPDGLTPAQRIEQHYLVSGDPEVRLRQIGGDFLLTAKSGDGDDRLEAEGPIDPSLWSALLALAKGGSVSKRRHTLDGWEIDLYDEFLSGLQIMEREVDSLSAPLPSFPPQVEVIREVTAEREFKNSRLAKMSAKEAYAFIHDVYAP